jgi:hypothetical protein
MTAEAYAIAQTDADGRVSFLTRTMALQGSMMRTYDPFRALTFSSLADARKWINELPPRWLAQLQGRRLEVRRLAAEVLGPGVHLHIAVNAAAAVQTGEEPIYADAMFGEGDT